MVDQETLDKLIEESIAVKQKAHCPYSQFRVGAALLATDGTIIAGCNVENASNSATVCAERSAICVAVSRGYRQFRAVAVASDVTSTFISPCGVCRQSLVEFSPDMLVYLIKPDRSFHQTTLADLLPMSFTPSSLKEPRLSPSVADGGVHNQSSLY
jgi:cytidine deaminase